MRFYTRGVSILHVPYKSMLSIVNWAKNQTIREIKIYQSYFASFSATIFMLFQFSIKLFDLRHFPPPGRNIWSSDANIISEFANHKLAFCCSLVGDWYLVGSAGPDIPSGGLPIMVPEVIFYAESSSVTRKIQEIYCDNYCLLSCCLN